MMLRLLAIAVVAALIPAAALAQPVVQVVTAARVTAVADRLAATLITDPDKAITPALSISDQNVPPGEVTIVAGSPLVNPTFIAIPVTISVDGKASRTLMAGYRVKQFIHTAVASHDLAPGAVLAEEDVTVERVAFTGRLPVEAPSLVGRRLRGPASKGVPLFMEQTSVVELVKAGSSIVLVVRDGPVALTADVVARTGGGLGDIVAVYNPTTRKALTGVVTGPNRVELNLPGASE
jgi:flagella basal body P-ring formation protein FlgA